MTTRISAKEAKALLQKPKQSKYRAKPTEVDGIRFASKAEARRYADLKRLERAGEIEALRLQPRYPLIVNNFHVCTYIADFAYLDKNTDREVVEDTKGVRTRDFIIKAKLFHALYGREVTLS
ncbi:DUF1064 domain-containing protein [Corticibacterium sp. UT-5YL-CI-8]|nr:DUF1064 domain-containing protein [Tianweitania sp. UT-5YL-CI-8]